MKTFTLWADRDDIATMQLVVFDGNGAETAHDLYQGDDHIWHAAIDAPPGTLYKFQIDGDPDRRLPDPRSRFQPEGPHGPSMVVESAYDWQAEFNAVPLAEAILYELHIGTFTQEGTYHAAVGKLPELKALGITHVEVLPLAQASGSYNWGYDGVNLFAPGHSYGTPQDLKAFVDACHGHGIAVLHDVVYNHFGPEGNYSGMVAPYLTDPATRNTDWGAAVNLADPHVRAFIIDNALMWLDEYRFDGLRLDAVDALHDETDTHIMTELSARVDALMAQSGRRLVLIAEFDQNDPTVVRPRDQGGWGLTAQWADNFHHALRTVITGDCTGYFSDFGSLELLAKALQKAMVFEGEYSHYRGRDHGHPYGVLPGDKFVVFDENHDQVGNRALGERLAHILSPDRAKIAPAIFILSRFTPMLFMGEEWASSQPFQFFSNHQIQAIAEGTSEGRNYQFQRFGFKAIEVADPQDPATFARSKLNWNERDEPGHAETLAWYKSLIALRRSIPDYGKDPAVEVAYDEDRKWLKFSHSGITVLCNFAEETQRISLGAGQTIVLASCAGYTVSDDHVLVPGSSVVVSQA